MTTYKQALTKIQKYATELQTARNRGKDAEIQLMKWTFLCIELGLQTEQIYSVREAAELFAEKYNGRGWGWWRDTYLCGRWITDHDIDLNTADRGALLPRGWRKVEAIEAEVVAAS